MQSSHNPEDVPDLLSLFHLTSDTDLEKQSAYILYCCLAGSDIEEETASLGLETSVSLAKRSKEFHSHANEAKNLLVSTCGFMSSGCHDFGATLITYYPKFDHIVAMVLNHRVEEVKAITVTPQSYTNLFITGCHYFESALIVQHLSCNYDFKNLTHVYVIPPPHKAKNSYDNKAELISDLRKSFSHVPYTLSTLQVRVINVGIDSLRSIGIPKPIFALQEAKQITSDDTFGLMYFRQPEFAGIGDDYFLDTYFNLVALAAESHCAKSINIIAIKFPDKVRELVDATAAKHSITIQYEDKLPPADFIEAVKQIVKRGGVLSFDGIQALLQVCYFGGKVLIHSHPKLTQNIDFYSELANSVSSKLQPIAKVILGLDQHYTNLLDDPELGQKVFEAFHTIIDKSVTRFESDKSKYSADTSSELAAATKLSETRAMSLGASPKKENVEKQEELPTKVLTTAPESGYLAQNFFNEKNKTSKNSNLSTLVFQP